jgi:hypothetical protein
MERRVEHALVGLADGTLRDSERERAATLIAGHEPELAAQRRARSALGAFAVEAPPELRARIAALEPPPARRRLVPVAAVAVAAVAIVLAIVVSGAPEAPPPATLAAATDLPATGPPRLDRSFAGVRYSDWEGEFGWRATGRRADRVAGRQAETVFYEHQGHRIGYTVLDGEAYEPPPGGREYELDGTTVWIYAPRGTATHDRGHGAVSERVAVFERNGRTCVLAGEVLDEGTLVRLVAAET